MYLTECMIGGQMMNNLKITFNFIQFDQQNFGYVCISTLSLSCHVLRLVLSMFYNCERLSLDLCVYVQYILSCTLITMTPKYYS